MRRRRQFLKNAFAIGAGFVATGFLPSVAKEKQAETIEQPVKTEKTSFTQGVVYTKDNQGKWEGKDKSHLPMVTLDGKKVTIETNHKMTEKHYIVRHTLVSEKGEVLGEKTFASSDEKPISEFELTADYKKLYVTSFCNKHDLWLTEITL